MKNLKKVTLVTGVILLSVTLSVSVFAQQTSTLTDPEIASIAVVANQNDIDFANVAKEKFQDPQILQFATTMITDHTAVIDQAVALVTKLGITLKDNPVSQEYVSNAKKTIEMLNSKSGNEFDKAYVDNEVAYHKAVIEAVKTVLIPQTQNEELKAFFQKIMPVLETHLEHAEFLQKQIN